MRKNILQGPTFKGLISYLGLLSIIGGIVSVTHHYVLAGIFELIFGVFLFLNIKGTIIDTKSGFVKPYSYFLFFRFGKKYDIKRMNEVLVVKHKDSVRMNSRGTSGEYRTRSHNVLLLNNSGHKILLKQFSKKEQAEGFRNEIKKVLKL